MGVIHSNHFWIPMPDGARLGARLWMPDGKDSYPAILEYIPYRKDDSTVIRDSNTIAHFAKHGYACIRVDILTQQSLSIFHIEKTITQLNEIRIQLLILLNMGMPVSVLICAELEAQMALRTMNTLIRK